MIDVRPLLISDKDAWLNYGLGGEIDAWLNNIDKKTRRIIRQEANGRHLFVEQAELFYNYAALINRLMHFSYRSVESLTTTQISNRIAKWTRWPSHVAYAFWRGIRDPIIHLGRTSPSADYQIPYKHKNIHVGYQELKIKQPKTLPKPIWADPWQRGTGWEQYTVMDHDGNIDYYQLNFNFHGVRKMTQVMVDALREEVSKMSDDEIKELEALNQRMPFFYSVIQSERAKKLDAED